MKQSLFYLFLCSLLVSGCAGKVPQPVSQQSPAGEEMIAKQHKKLKNMVLGENVVPFRWK